MSDRCFGERVRVTCPMAECSGVLDRLCDKLRNACVAYGYLSAYAPLISTISVLENLWLPHAWQRGWSQRGVLHRIDAVLTRHQSSPEPDQDILNLHKWMGLYPAELTAHQVEAAVIMRAALGQPEVVVMDAGWPTASRSMQLLESASWWWVTPELDALIAPSGWITMPHDEALRR